MKSAIVFVIFFLVAACASSGMTTADRLALYRANAGAPVNGFSLDRSNRFHRWTPLGDEAVAIWTTANQGHLLEFRSRCSGLGLASSITISNSVGRVTARFDSVQLRTNPGAPAQSCRIWTIRPLDGQALRDAQRELREYNVVERAADVVPEE